MILTEQHQPIGYLELLRSNMSYRRLFFARMISLLGDWFHLLAILALLRGIGHDSATAFAGVIIVKSLATFLVLPVAGVWADRVSRLRLMIVSDLGRAVAVLAMFSVLIWPSMPLLISLVALQSGLTALFEPAKNAIFPDILSDRELVAANALGAAMWSTMLTVGSALGGWFTDIFGWQAALLVDASTYVVSALLIWTLREPDANRAVSNSMWLNLREGAQHLLTHRNILSLALVKMMWSVAGAVTILLALLGENRFSLTESGLISVGLFYMARGLGTGLGPFLARWLSNEDPRRMEGLIGWGFVCGGVFYVLMPWAPTIGTAMLLVTLAHLGGATVWVFSTVRLQQQLASEIRGRVFAVEHALFLVMSVISTAIYSWLSDSVGISAQNLLGATGISLLLVAALWWWFHPKSSTDTR